LASGLLALLDDVVALVKVAAASLDDAATQTIKASAKAAGVVIDDAAVTPRYVVGFAEERELPIIARIARGSLKNKILFLLPAALFLSAFAEWAIMPLLMIGGLFLCFEGYEKVHQMVAPNDAHASTAHAASHAVDAKALGENRDFKHSHAGIRAVGCRPSCHGHRLPSCRDHCEGMISPFTSRSAEIRPHAPSGRSPPMACRRSLGC
jgi:predicted DNA repair protein MutK